MNNCRRHTFGDDCRDTRAWNAFEPYAPERALRAFACVFLHGGKCASRELLGGADRGGHGGKQQPEPWELPTAIGDDPCASCSDYASAFVGAREAKMRPW